MSIESDDAVVQVLKEAIQHEHFFDLCDAERLAWMIERAFVLGTQSVGGTPLRQSGACLGVVHEHHASARTVRGQERRKS